MTALFQLIWRLFQQRAMIGAMARRELRFRYAGTALGVFWSVANPLAQVAVYWFVFSVGFKVQTVGTQPYLLFFICGLAPWMFFTEAVTGSLGAIVGSAHLVKKTVFPTEILPMVKVTEALIVHIPMLAIIGAILLISREAITWRLLLLPYFLFSAAALALGFGWLLSALYVFFRDVGQMLGTVLNVWFWITPIVWPPEKLPPRLWPVFDLNPMFYVVDGYRAALLHAGDVAIRPWQTLYFWAVCLVLLAVGAGVFRRLKAEFAEML